MLGTTAASANLSRRSGSYLIEEGVNGRWWVRIDHLDPIMQAGLARRVDRAP